MLDCSHDTPRRSSDSRYFCYLVRLPFAFALCLLPYALAFYAYHHCPTKPAAPPAPDTSPVNPQKQRKGLQRLWHAALYSIAGLKAAWAGTPAFRLEVFLFALMLPAAFYLGKNWVEFALLLSTGVLLMVVELLNTAIETAIDRIGLEHHPLSGMAKDLGSAAVFVASLYTALVWGLAAWAFFRAFLGF